MKCSSKKLSAWVDGDLKRFTARRLERHVAGCSTCQKEVAELTALRGELHAWGRSGRADFTDESQLPQNVAALPPELEAARQRLAAESRSRGLQLGRSRWLVGAVGVAALGVCLLAARQRILSGPSDQHLLSEATSEFQQADREYRHALDTLYTVAKHVRPSWSPERQRQFDAAWFRLEGATEECRTVARTRPTDPEAAALLYEAYRRQIAFFEEQLTPTSSGRP